MAFDKLYIVNEMMIEIGEKTLQGLGEDAKSQRLATQSYDGTVEEVFALPIPYHFATTRAQLSRLVATPAFGYDYMYYWPEGCFRIIETVNSESKYVKYEFRREVYLHTENGKIVQDDVLLCDQDECYVKFIVLRTNPACWPAWFRRLVILRGACKLCAPLNENDYRKMSLKKDYEEAKDDARAANAADAKDVSETGADEFDGSDNIADGVFNGYT